MRKYVTKLSTACGELGDEDIMQYLIPAANDEDIDVQLAVMQALGKIGGNEAKLYLQKHADEPNEALRMPSKPR